MAKLRADALVVAGEPFFDSKRERIVALAFMELAITFEGGIFGGLVVGDIHVEDVIASLHVALVETLADPSVRQRLAELGQGIWPREQQTPEALAAQQEAEHRGSSSSAKSRGRLDSD
jgi:hypothetical protein